MVVSQFHLVKRGNFLGSTIPLDWLTEGILIFEVKRT